MHTCNIGSCSTGVRPTWRRLIDGQSGIVSTKDLGPKFAALPSQVAGLIPIGTRLHGGWDAQEWLQPGVSTVNEYDALS